jgi:hypothetical protein
VHEISNSKTVRHHFWAWANNTPIINWGYLFIIWIEVESWSNKKKYGIEKKMRCYWEHLGRHNWKTWGTFWEHIGNKQSNQNSPLLPYEFTVLFFLCTSCPINLWIYFHTSQASPYPLSPFACCTLKDYYILVARILCMLCRHVSLILGME